MLALEHLIMSVFPPRIPHTGDSTPGAADETGRREEEGQEGPVFHASLLQEAAETEEGERLEWAAILDFHRKWTTL